MVQFHDSGIIATMRKWHTDDQQRSHNSQAKKIMAYSKNGKLIAEFPSLMDAAIALQPNLDYNNQEDYVKLRHCVNGIWRAVNGKRKSYRGMIWKYPKAS